MPTTDKANCLICDREWFINVSRVNEHLLCRECRTTEKSIDYGMGEPCKPWHGDFDENDNPMRLGTPYRPGPRICNHKDCIEPSHIVGYVPSREKKLYAESRATLAGKPIDYEDFLKFLRSRKLSVPGSKLETIA